MIVGMKLNKLQKYIRTIVCIKGEDSTNNKKYKSFGSTANHPSSGCPRKIPTQMVWKIARLVKNNPRTRRKQLQEHLADECVDASLKTVCNNLYEAELHRRRPKKTPLLKDVHMKALLRFVRECVDDDDIFSRQVLLSDETKIRVAWPE